MTTISRRDGRSAVAASAYRAGEKLENERDGLTHNYRRKRGVAHSQIVLPEGSDAEWARDRSKLWNAAEAGEKRKDARVAREFEVALPHELSPGQRIELAHTFAKDLADRYGTAVDFAVHVPVGKSDSRNHHAHLMMTTRAVSSAGLGAKTNIEREDKWLAGNGLPTSRVQLKEIRLVWEQHENEHLARADYNLQVDCRSHEARSFDIVPTRHVGVDATQMEQRGLEISRRRLDEDSFKLNAELILEKPEQALELITAEKSVFDYRDVARCLHRYIDDADSFQRAFAKVMSMPELVMLKPERRDKTGRKYPARYSTKEMVALESRMAADAKQLLKKSGYKVRKQHADSAIAHQDAAIRSGVEAEIVAKEKKTGPMDPGKRNHRLKHARLSDEQRLAIRHVTGPERIAAVAGAAGAGKSTMLAAAREAWQASGHRVHGAALAGKAADGLQESSGIESRTLASWEQGWKAGFGKLGRGDVLVIDEAGMAGSHQLARFVAEVKTSGAKLVLVGDPEQLQPIGAGAAFRAITERIGAINLREIRRQRKDWQRKASINFASRKTARALAAYEKNGGVRFLDGREDVLGSIVRDYKDDWKKRPQGSRVALAHRRVDVRSINEAIRAARKEDGELAQSEDVEYETNDGVRGFARGDRIVMLANNRDIGVKNGMLGTVEEVGPDKIRVKLDDRAKPIAIPVKSYQEFDYGYATTIHKAQGATVDRAFVMASNTMDRHLTYVAMTRHRFAATLYADRDEFKNTEKLAYRLGRAGKKETTLDLTRSFAERRGIFGFLDAVKKPIAKLVRAMGGKSSPLLSGKKSFGSDFERMIDDYACALYARDKAGDGSRHGKEMNDAAWQAAKALDRTYPKARRIFHSALVHDKTMLKAFWNLSGRDRMTALINGMDNEWTLQKDPAVRAERYLSQYRRVEKARKFLPVDDPRLENINKRRRDILNLVERDPKAGEVIRKLEERNQMSKEPAERWTSEQKQEPDPSPGPGFGR